MELRACWVARVCLSCLLYSDILILNNISSSLATEKEHVRARLAAYVNDLMSLGVDGLRLDAAKHIPPEDLANIFSRIAAKPYITQVYSAVKIHTPRRSIDIRKLHGAKGIPSAR
jgi:glycosidase